MKEVQYLTNLKVVPSVASREKANEILNLWRSGAAFFASNVINAALMATGDIEPRRAARREWRR